MMLGIWQLCLSIHSSAVAYWWNMAGTNRSPKGDSSLHSISASSACMTNNSLSSKHTGIVWKALLKFYVNLSRQHSRAQLLHYAHCIVNSSVVEGKSPLVMPLFMLHGLRWSWQVHIIILHPPVFLGITPGPEVCQRAPLFSELWFLCWVHHLLFGGYC